MDKPYQFTSGGMNEATAIDVASRIESMGFESTIRVDDFDQFQVSVTTPEEQCVFKNFAEYQSWFEGWCDTHMGGGNGTVRIFESGYVEEFWEGRVEPDYKDLPF